MGVLLIYPILLFCLLVPPILIYRSPAVAGWRKFAWVLSSFLSAFAPIVLATLGIALAEMYFGYERDLRSEMFGPEAYVMAVVNIAVLVLPWVVFVIFQARYGKKSTPSPDP